MEQINTSAEKEGFWKPTKFKIIFSIIICILSFLTFGLLLSSCFNYSLTTFCEISGYIAMPLFYIFSAPELLVRALAHPSAGFYESERNIHTIIKIVSVVFNPAFALFLAYTLASFISKLKKGRIYKSSPSESAE